MNEVISSGNPGDGHRQARATTDIHLAGSSGGAGSRRTSLQQIAEWAMPSAQMGAADALRAAITARDAGACRSAAIAYGVAASDRWGAASVPKEDWIRAALALDEHEAFGIDPPEVRRWILDTAMWWILGMRSFNLKPIASVAAHNPAMSWQAAADSSPAIATALAQRVVPGPFDVSEDALTLLACVGGHLVRKLHAPRSLAADLAWDGPRLAASLDELVAAGLAEVPASLWSAAAALSTDELKRLCASARLPTSGTKAVLVDRLRVARKGNTFAGKIDSHYLGKVAIGVSKAQYLSVIGGLWEARFYRACGDDRGLDPGARRLAATVERPPETRSPLPKPTAIRRTRPPIAEVAQDESAVVVELAALVADALRGTGRSTRDLARHLGIDQASVSRLMNRKQNSPATLERILRQLGYGVHITITPRIDAAHPLPSTPSLPPPS